MTERVELTEVIVVDKALHEEFLRNLATLVKIFQGTLVGGETKELSE